MLFTLLKTVHLAGIIVWVGGMVFAHFFLRPAAAALEPPQRLTLMHAVLGRFFASVTVASLAVWVSGVWMVGNLAKAAVQSGAGFRMPADWWLMALLGTLMVAIYGYIRLVPYRRLAAAVAAKDWPAGGAAMNAIRRWVTVNLALGWLIVVVVLIV